MRRRAWSIFCGFSLLVFVLSVGIWVRSWFVMDYLSWSRAWTDQTLPPDAVVGRSIQERSVTYGIASWRGAMVIVRDRVTGDQSHFPGWVYAHVEPRRDVWASPTMEDRVNLRFAGLQYTWRYWTGNGKPVWRSERRVIFSLWFCLPAAIPPVLWWRRSRRSRGRGFPAAE